MDEEPARVFLPPRERYFERLRLARFGVKFRQTIDSSTHYA
jgi:hypothetical protein